MQILQRLWTGIVASLAGAAVGIPVGIGLKSYGASLDALLWTVGALAGLGFIAGIAFGGPKQKSSDKDRK